MAVRFCCDWCEKQLPVTITGVDGKDKKITAELTFPREVNVRKYFPHLCESCARKIDNIVRLSRDSYFGAVSVMDRYSEINRERREKLGTKG